MAVTTFIITSNKYVNIPKGGTTNDITKNANNNIYATLAIGIAIKLVTTENIDSFWNETIINGIVPNCTAQATDNVLANPS